MKENSMESPLAYYRSWEDIYCYIKSLFLDATESNISNLLKDIETVINHLPRNNLDNPYIGNLGGNYEILKNHEIIPDIPSNKKEILIAVSQIFSGLLKWHHPHVMHNVNPPPMISSVAIGCIANLYNPNPLWDFISAGVQKTEQQIVRQMSSLCGWEGEGDGIFTFGGKGCLTYAIRIGLNRCLEKVSSQGLSGVFKPPIVITSESNHYSIDTVCSLIGIGYKNCLRVRTNSDETMDIKAFELILNDVIKQGYPIAAIIVSGGNTLHLSIDNLYEVRNIIDKYVQLYSLKYQPYIYFDTVVGWSMLFYKEYDFHKNPILLPERTKKIIASAFQKINAVKLADGFGIDFHKTGFCPYLTSLFMTKNGAELHSIHKDEITSYNMKPFGNNFLQHHTIEHSRTAAPILSAWVALQTAGKKGYQSYLANHIEVACEIREVLSKYGFELLNSFSLGFASVFSPKRKSHTSFYFDLLGESSKNIEEYNQYTYRLFLYLQKEESNGYSSFILRFLPQYRQSLKGENISVIVIYPMAMFINKEVANNLAHLIGKIKIDFDEDYKVEKDIFDIIPTHVPK